MPNTLLFLFDITGTIAFAMVGAAVFVGFLTGVGVVLMRRIGASWHVAMIVGFALVILLRILAAGFRWNLPRIPE